MITGKKVEHSIVGGMLGEGVRMEGNLSFKQTFRVDGEFKGKIADSERLVVGEKGNVQGEIECDSLICYGKITGTIKIKGCVEVHPSGRIEGDLFMENPLLTVLEGGTISGNLKMGIKEGSNVLPIKEKTKEI